jgi:hypothetical protein
MDERTAFDVADWELERYRLGELPPAEMERMQRAVETREDVRARVKALEDADDEHLRRHPPAMMAGAIRARLAQTEALEERRATRTMRAWALRPAVAAALGLGLLAVGLAVLRPGVAPDTPTFDGENRIKGLSPRLVVFRQTDMGPEALASGAAARRGEVVQIAYQAAGRTYGAIISADGRGSVTLHLPQDGLAAAALDGKGVIPLDRAFALDDAPLFERFYFVTAKAPFDLPAVLAAVHHAHATPDSPSPVELPPGLELSVFTLKKETS